MARRVTRLATLVLDHQRILCDIHARIGAQRISARYEGVDVEIDGFSRLTNLHAHTSYADTAGFEKMFVDLNMCMLRANAMLNEHKHAAYKELPALFDADSIHGIPPPALAHSFFPSPASSMLRTNPYAHDSLLVDDGKEGEEKEGTVTISRLALPAASPAVSPEPSRDAHAAVLWFLHLQRHRHATGGRRPLLYAGHSSAKPIASAAPVAARRDMATHDVVVRLLDSICEAATSLKTAQIHSHSEMECDEEEIVRPFVEDFVRYVSLAPQNLGPQNIEDAQAVVASHLVDCRSAKNFADEFKGHAIKSRDQYTTLVKSKPDHLHHLHGVLHH
eukprot:TRINITY_DN56092_c0_g1_i1.p1 TRINITY_DN56092_c0_g1~~TRINITY_DN56092_c0_g1_i1.p1  ORF type:complete len:333 (+),score=55.61 TRINITY_DN56092_c0_g1_i1:111-1109(+)